MNWKRSKHRGTRKGAIRGGFDRTEFFKNSEKSFDIGFNHSRDFKESFEFQNTMKNGSVESVKELPERAREFEQERKQEQSQEQNQEQKQTKPGQNLNQEQNHGQDQDYGQDYDQEKKQRKSRGMGR